MCWRVVIRAAAVRRASAQVSLIRGFECGGAQRDDGRWRVCARRFVANEQQAARPDSRDRFIAFRVVREAVDHFIQVRGAKCFPFNFDFCLGVKNAFMCRIGSRKIRLNCFDDSKWSATFFSSVNRLFAYSYFYYILRAFCGLVDRPVFMLKARQRVSRTDGNRRHHSSMSPIRRVCALVCARARVSGGFSPTNCECATMALVSALHDDGDERRLGWRARWRLIGEGRASSGAKSRLRQVQIRGGRRSHACGCGWSAHARCGAARARADRDARRRRCCYQSRASAKAPLIARRSSIKRAPPRPTVSLRFISCLIVAHRRAPLVVVVFGGCAHACEAASGGGARLRRHEARGEP